MVPTRLLKLMHV